MNKQTKRNRRNRPKNKTKKYYGGASQGIFDLIGSKLSDYGGKITSYAADKGLRLIGLQTIKDNEPNEPDESTKEVDEKINQLSDSATGVISGFVDGAKDIGSNVVDVVDKGSAAVIGNINEVLQSPKIENSVSEAAEETAKIGEKLLEEFNDKLSSPIIKEQTKEALDNVADVATIAITSMDEPINKGIDELNAAGTKALSGAVTGAVKVGTDALAAVPGMGAVVELGKIVNDASRAVGDVVEAGTDATSTAAKIVQETTENINEGIDKLEETKKEGSKIYDRTNESIESFENPIKNPIMKAGARKTRRKLFKRKGKSKRVRWAI